MFANAEPRELPQFGEKTDRLPDTLNTGVRLLRLFAGKARFVVPRVSRLPEAA